MHEKLGLVLLSEVTNVCFRVGEGSVQEHLPENVKKIDELICHQVIYQHIKIGIRYDVFHNLNLSFLFRKV